MPAESVDNTAQPGRSQVLRAASIVSVAFVASRLLGLGRDITIGYYYGATSIEANAYRLASRIPETIFFIIAGGALGSAFIPTFAAYFARKDSAGGWRLFSGVINLVFLVLAVVSGIVALLAVPFLTLYLPELKEQPALLELSARLLRVLLLSTAIFGVSGVAMGALNARQHFLLPALAPIIYNVGIIAGVIVGENSRIFAPGVMGLAWGTVAGAVGHLLIQVPGLRWQGARYSLVLSLRDRGIRKVLRLMAPRMVGLSFSQINNLIIPTLAQSLFIVAALDFAWRIVLMPQSILGQAMGIAAFPTFATLAAERALPQMRRILVDTLRLILFVGFPATVLLMVLSRPVVSLAFERGAFDAADTNFVAWALLFYAPGLVALAALEVISRAFYALEDTRTPVAAGALQLAVMAALALLFSRWLFPLLGWESLGGLALGVTLSNLLEAAFLLWLLRRKMGGRIGGTRLLDGLWRMAIAAAAAGSAGWFVQGSFDHPLWQLAFASLVAGLVYVAFSLVLQVSEVRQLLEVGRRRLRR